MLSEFANNYYHFTIEVLPEILNNNKIYVELEFVKPNFILQYEELLSLPLDYLIPIGSTKTHKSLHSQQRNLNLAHLRYLRNLNRKKHPKRKISKTRRDKRRTHYKATIPQIATCPTTGEAHLYHRAHWYEGKLYYKGQVLIDNSEAIDNIV